MAPHVLLALVASAAASAAAQDVSDCTWQPEAEAGAGAELECRLKTLQTGPAVIPQVRSSATHRYTHVIPHIIPSQTILNTFTPPPCIWLDTMFTGDRALVRVVTRPMTGLLAQLH